MVLLSHRHPPLQLLASGGEKAEVDQPGCCATLFTGEPNFPVRGCISEHTCVGAAGPLGTGESRKGRAGEGPGGSVPVPVPVPDLLIIWPAATRRNAGTGQSPLLDSGRGARAT